MLIRVLLHEWARRAAITSSLALAGGLLFSPPALAVTLKLAFPDGAPMTYGSACSGDGCLQRGAAIGVTDGNGVVLLADTSDHTVEYRREGIDLTQAPAGDASGELRDVGARATAVLPRLLLGYAPDVDADESDVVARINAERSAKGLAPAVLNARLSTAADLQATWLDGASIGLPLPVLSHIGPYGTTPAFRLGEASFPEPTMATEIAAAGLTPAEAVSVWLASAPHRAQILAPGAPLIGVGKVGTVIILDMHPPCRGCDPTSPSNSGSAGAGTPGAMTPAGNSGVPSAGGKPGAPAQPGAATHASSCGAEQLRVRRLATQRGRLRLSASVRCLRPGARYSLSVLQRPSRKVLKTRAIRGAGAVVLALRPSRSTRTLRVKLKRNGRAIVARSITRRPAPRR